MGADVTAVVVSHDSAQELPACLEALCAAERVQAVVVVDNASEDRSAELVRGFGEPRLQLVEAGANTGFAGGCNRGWRAAPAASRHLAFLNPDVVVEPDCLERCAAELDRDHGLGGVAPRLMRPDGRVDSVGQVLQPATLEVRDRGYGKDMAPELSQVRPVLAACGALAVFRRSALDVVADDHGPWAEHFFCFWEDLELGWRMSNQGLPIVALPQAVAVHGRGAGADEGQGPLRWRRPPQLEACILSNRWMTLIRHLHPLDLALRLPLLLPWDLLAVAAGILHRPQLVRHLKRRWPLVRQEWKRRAAGPRRRLAELPC